MSKIVSYIEKILQFFSVLFTMLFCAVVIIQIFSRTLLPKTPSWTEELARYFFIYAVAFAAGLAAKNNSYVSVDILTAKIPEKFQKLFQISVNFALLVFCGFFLFGSVPKFAFLKARLVSTALEWPMQYIYFSMVLLFGMLTLTYVYEIIRLIISKNSLEGGR